MFIKDGKEFEVIKIEDINMRHNGTDPRGEEIIMVAEQRASPLPRLLAARGQRSSRRPLGGMGG